jgi:transcriptional regulator with XRE-family HTH domain
MTQMGSIIRSAREAKELTQASLAEKIDVSIRTIIAIEKNQRNPTYEVLYRLVRTLDISADLIFNPEQAHLSPEQDQLVRELLACGEKEQRIAMATLRSLIKALKQEGNHEQV